MALVEVRPIEKDTWHGKNGAENFTRPQVISCAVNAHTGLYDTGLSEEDRKRLEKATGFDLSDNYNPNEKHSFWSKPISEVKLEWGSNIFNIERPLDEIKVKMLKASDLVANSMQDYNEGKYPLALFVITDEQEQTVVKAAKAAIKRNAIIEASKLSTDKKIEAVYILLGQNVRGNSNDYIDLKVDEAIDKAGPEAFLNLISREGAKNTIQAFILEATDKGILTRTGTSYSYMDIHLGGDIEDAISFFENKKNQPLRIQIMEKLR
jgi:hypothetical protein